MANTYELIASSTVGAGGAASIDFTSIPNTYTDLCIKISARFASSSTLIKITYNSNTSNYARRGLVGENATTASYSGSDAFIAYTDASTNTSNTFGSADVYIPNYSGNGYKSASIDTTKEQASADAVTAMTASVWSNTSAITSISLSDLSGGQNFLQ
jgi:hypothetical protein